MGFDTSDIDMCGSGVGSGYRRKSRIEGGGLAGDDVDTSEVVRSGPMVGESPHGMQGVGIRTRDTGAESYLSRDASAAGKHHFILSYFYLAYYLLFKLFLCIRTFY